MFLPTQKQSGGRALQSAFQAWVTLAMCLVWAASQAAAPLARSQAPGFYRMMLGDIEITALNDGVFDLQTNELLTNATPTTARLLAPSCSDRRSAICSRIWWRPAIGQNRSIRS